MKNVVLAAIPYLSLRVLLGFDIFTTNCLPIAICPGRLYQCATGRCLDSTIMFRWLSVIKEQRKNNVVVSVSLKKIGHIIYPYVAQCSDFFWHKIVFQCGNGM